MESTSYFRRFGCAYCLFQCFLLQLDDMGAVKFSRSDFCSQEIEFKVAQLIMHNKRLKGSNSCIILFKYFN